MLRNFNTKRDGYSFDESIIEAVWRKGQLEPQYLGFRKDVCGASMQRSKYGKTEQFGWEIDHIVPVSRGGGDNIDNLQPLRWENNRYKGDDLSWTCKLEF